MRLRFLILFIPFALAGLAAALGATLSANLIEKRSEEDVTFALKSEGIDWADVTANGLQVRLSGVAPTEARRFRALTIAGGIIDSARVIDLLAVEAAAEIAPPSFSLEVLRNSDGVSLIGLIPAATDRETVVNSLEDLTGGDVADLLEVADHPTPRGWDEALAFSLDAIGRLPRSKISVTPTRIEITASSDSEDARARIIRNLTRTAPDTAELVMNITSPRPVISPFILRFTKDASGSRFDACSADTEATAQQILRAGRAAGAPEASDCTLGLGVPSTSWGAAAASGIAALSDLGGGSITFSNADVSLVALDSTPAEVFDRVVGALKADLPEVFSLTAVLPEPVKIDGTGEGDGPPEFVATKSPEGLVQLRGRVPDDETRTAIESFARARFGAGNVHFGARTDGDLPQGWPIRVLAALESLSYLENGSTVVQEEFVELRGTTGQKDASDVISRILSEKLGEQKNFDLQITYEEALDPIAAQPSPEECVKALNTVLKAGKITFEPGSTNISGAARDTISKMADILKQCPQVEMEIAGHTDSQGREEMNQQLSQARAQSVLNALAGRRILTGHISAKGYGESRPIADNETEEGREANRRIEVSLVEVASDQENPPEGGEEEVKTDP